VGMLLSTQWTREHGTSASPLKGGIAISGIFDLRPLMQSWLQVTLNITEALATAESPLLRIPSSSPPLMISVGGDESAAFLDQSSRYVAALQAATLDVEQFPQPGLNHYQTVNGFDDAQSPLACAVADFVRRKR
jgi:arylformamidase